jgi:hypothetical protein
VFPLGETIDIKEEESVDEEAKKEDNSLVELLMNEIDDVRDLLTHQELSTLDLFA